MKVKIRYLGPVRMILNKKEEEVEVPIKATLADLMSKLVGLYGDSFKEEVFEPDGKIRDGLVVTINGIAVGQLGGTKMRLNEGDAITLLPFFAGGG